MVGLLHGKLGKLPTSLWSNCRRCRRRRLKDCGRLLPLAASSCQSLSGRLAV